MERAEQVEAVGDGSGVVGQRGDGGFVVRLDRRRVFGERPPRADEPVQVAVGQVVDDLPQRPSAVAVGRVELGVGQAVDRGAEQAGQRVDLVDPRRKLVVGDGSVVGEAADGIASVGHGERVRVRLARSVHCGASHRLRTRCRTNATDTAMIELPTAAPPGHLPLKGLTGPYAEPPIPTDAPIASRQSRLVQWKPKRVLFTQAALDEPFGRQILERVQSLGLHIERLNGNRVTSLRGSSERETYRIAKSTLVVANAPKGQFKLQPIPPSADYQFHLAQGCPAHCQYCYLAGSLSGPPTTRVYANLPQILENTVRFERPGVPTSFEASCYTDPLALEHLTGSLSAAITHFGTRPPDAHLRWVTKFASVDGLIDLDHGGRTRPRFSINAREVERFFEGGTDGVDARLGAARKLALGRSEGGGGYPVGLVVAPIVPVDGWRGAYADLLDRAADALDMDCDLTFELITHRFTPGSKNVLQGWYPKSKLDLSEQGRSEKRNKFGGVKYVYTAPQMKELRGWFQREIAARFPAARILYWT